MSLFTDGSSTEGTDQTKQAEGTTETQTSFLEQLVQAKGENWRDTETLAKGKLQADTYIQELENQLNQMREDIAKNDYAAQVLEELRGKAADTSTAKTSEANPKDTAGVDETETPSSLNEDTLKSLVEKTLADREAQTKVQTNLQQVQTQLTQRFGEQAGDAVKAKAEELGMSLQKLEEVASESPAAFMAMFGPAPQSQANSLLNGSVNTEGVNMQASTQRNWNYYQKMRRENPNQYYSPKVQQQLMADKMKMGDSFGNT